MARQKQPIRPDHIRRIRGSFSWIDHRFLHGGFLRASSRDELLLYYFLVTVGDKNGVSFYGYEKICHLLKMNPDRYIQARDCLINRQLIAFRAGIFQVLPLPEHCQSPRTARGDTEMYALGDIFKRLGQKP